MRAFEPAEFVSTAVIAVLAWLSYLILVSIYRVYFHPLSHIPGPKIAAASLWYETYWDVFQGGQYTFRLRKLHEIYGPIIRISPEEIHIDDPEFVDKLYTGSSKKTDKYGFMTSQFGSPDSVFGTVSHDLHRMRRAALNPFFSKASIVRFEPRIRAKILRMCNLIDNHYRGSTKPLPIARAFSCLTTDIVTDYSFNDSRFLDSPTFEPNLHKAISAGTNLGPVVKHFPWIGTLLRAVPLSIMQRLDPEIASFIQYQVDMKTQIQAVHEQKQPTSDPPANIFDALVYGSLPTIEKSVARLWQEGQVVISAGTETTARTLEVALFYLLSEPAQLKRLDDDLTAIMPDAETIPSWSVLENVVYLIMITESLRLSYGITSRLQRAFREPLVYDSPKTDGRSYTIPAGTPVGMTSMLLHHNEEVFPVSDSFRPERWIREDGTFDTHLYGYLVSFSKGTRQCLGINLAYAEMYMIFAAIIRRYGKTMHLHETTFHQDIEVVGDFFVPVSRRDKGLEVMLVNE